MTPTQKRLNSIINADVLPENDRKFARSLLDHYNKKGSLTAGRRFHLQKLEDKVQNLILNPPTFDENLVKEIETLASLPGRSVWESDILASFVSQVKSGKQLSTKQATVIENIKKVDAENAVWTFGAEERDNWNVAIAYYRHNPPYFGDFVNAVDSDPNYVPTRRNYVKVCENKHAQAAIASHKAAPAYAPGQAVKFSSNITSRSRKYDYNAQLRKLGFEKQTLDLSGCCGIVLASDAAPVISAAKGTKRYSILIYGASMPIIVEERDIKRNRAVKA